MYKISKLRSLIICVSFCWALLSGCGNGKGRLDVDVSGVEPGEVKIHRYDVDLFKVNLGQLQRGLESLKPEYRFFLDTDLNDPAKLSDMKAYLENLRNREFQQAVVRQYPQITDIEKELAQGLRHFNYYFPGSKIPRVYTYISGGDYEFPVQFADSVLLIGLDNYLGKN